jgi:hypothetical protein
MARPVPPAGHPRSLAAHERARVRPCHSYNVRHWPHRRGIERLLRRGQGRHLRFDAHVDVEGEPLGIKVNCIAPIALTTMSRKHMTMTDELAREMEVEYPVELVAPAVVALASEDCPAVGKVLDVPCATGAERVGNVSIELPDRMDQHDR